MKSISGAVVLYITLFIVLSMPFALALLPQNLNNTEFSIYNTNWNGLSDFRGIITSNYPDVQVKTLIGSENALNRLNQTGGVSEGSLVIMGPKIHYDPFEALAVLLYAAKGGRVVIADDFGTANDILTYFSTLISLAANTIPAGQTANLFGLNSTAGQASQTTCTPPKSNPFPIIGIAINRSVLVSIGSGTYYQSPVQPILTPPQTEPIQGTTYTKLATWLDPLITGVSSVVGNYAATISMKVKYPTMFKNNVTKTIIDSTQYFSLTSQEKCSYNPSTYKTLWVPFSEFPASITKTIAGKSLNVNVSLKLSALYSSQQSFLYPDVSGAKNVNSIHASSSDWGNIEFPIAISFPFGTTASSGSLTIISDPSIFINQYIAPGAYPAFNNRQFATNVINTLFADRPNSVVYFDEGHLAQSFTSPTLYLGSYFRYLDFMSMVPFIAPFLPFLVYGVARKLAPKGSYGTALLKTKAENYYGRSYFAFKMRWFLENRHFTRGLELIFRRTKRDLMHRYKMDEWSAQIAVSNLYREYPSLRKNLLKKILEIENVLNQNLLIEEQQFMDLYLVLSEINKHIKLQ